MPSSVELGIAGHDGARTPRTPVRLYYFYTNAGPVRVHESGGKKKHRARSLKVIQSRKITDVPSLLSSARQRNAFAYLGDFTESPLLHLKRSGVKRQAACRRKFTDPNYLLIPCTFPVSPNGRCRRRLCRKGRSNELLGNREENNFITSYVTVSMYFRDNSGSLSSDAFMFHNLSNMVKTCIKMTD